MIWKILLMLVMFALMTGCLYAAYILFNLGAGLAVAIPCLIAVACGIFIVHDILTWKEQK